MGKKPQQRFIYYIDQETKGIDNPDLLAEPNCGLINGRYNLSEDASGVWLSAVA